ncbi:regulator of chromosome condensation (RCC1)-like protein [Achlya hypogyna]|uniref:Regulator of chromosome condensation (RCC1)-like protein n=1 Tax=Achlya hypogyna TaxID=1202772 RepID=A0A1V9YG67_ACHHY|nr:regulator of chromosome condensation (RCC1)-like protein [Achlya hypogyna]
MAIVATIQGFKKNHGLMRPWRQRQFSLTSDGWLIWDKTQTGANGKRMDLVETEIGHEVVKSGPYFSFTVNWDGDVSSLGFHTQVDAHEWRNTMVEIADENAAGRREWTGEFKRALEETDLETRRELVTKIKPRDWNKEWQFCLRSQASDDFTLQLRRMKRMYGLWLQFNQYALMLADAIYHAKDNAGTAYTRQPGFQPWYDDNPASLEPRPTIYTLTPLVFQFAKEHWKCYQAIKANTRIFSTFKELYDVFRTIANTAASLGDEKVREVAQIKFPLAASFEIRDMRVLVFAQPLGDANPVRLGNQHIHNMLTNLRFTRPAQVLQALPYRELPLFSSIHRTAISDDVYLMNITSPYADIFRSDVRPYRYAGCLVPLDAAAPIQILTHDELLTMKETLEASKKGLVHYLNLKGIKNKFETLPYLDVMYFAREIMSTDINSRATKFGCTKMYGDVVFTFNAETSRLTLHLKEAFVLRLDAEARRYLALLQERDIASSSVERVEAHIKELLAAHIQQFAGRLITLGDATKEANAATLTHATSSDDNPAADGTAYIYVADTNHLRTLMKESGINMCFLPAVLGCTGPTQAGVKVLIMSEIVARVAKHLLRFKLLNNASTPRSEVAAGVVNDVMQGLAAALPVASQFWGVDLPVWVSLGPFSAAAYFVPESHLDAPAYHATLRRNPAPLFMALLRNLRVNLSLRVLNRLLNTSNSLRFGVLEAADIVPFDKCKVASDWSHMERADLSSFTHQLLQLETVFNTTVQAARPATAFRQTPASTTKSKGEGYLELFRSVDERVAGAMEGISDHVEEYCLERNIHACLRAALAAARNQDSHQVRAILTDVRRQIEQLPPAALLPIGFFLSCLFLEIFLYEDAGQQHWRTLVSLYIHAWKWLRLLYRPANTSHLLINASGHMLFLVLIVKLGNVLRSVPPHELDPEQVASMQKSRAMLQLLIQTLPTSHDFQRLLSPQFWFKKIDRHFLSLNSLYMPKALFQKAMVIPKAEVTRGLWAMNGAAFLEGNVMGMSLDMEQRHMQQNHDAPAAPATPAGPKVVDLTMLRFPPPMMQLIRFVSCGYRHAAIITTMGALFTFGYGECGRLGHGDEEAVRQPKRVAFFEALTATHAACGREHSMVVTSDGSLFGFGWGEAGRLGTGESGKALLPQKVDLPSVTTVGCGREHTLAVTSDGSLFAFGAGYSGRLGVGSEEDGHLPQRCALDETIRVVSAEAGECHSAAIDADGNVYTWGFGGSGALGLGTTDDALVPTIVPDMRATAVSCGAYHTAIVAPDGSVYGWGDALAGQLGDAAVGLGEMRPSPHKISIPNVAATNISCGSYTTGVLTTAGDVYHWGSPEAGNGAPLNPLDAVPLKVDMPDGIVFSALSCGAYQMIAATRVAEFMYEEETWM